MNDKNLKKLFDAPPEERKLFYDRRVFTYSYYIPERRSGKDRRKSRHDKWGRMRKVA